LAGLHFHWPSEHIIDNGSHVLELHAVHLNNGLPPETVIDDALGVGLAVLGVLFDIGEENAYLKPFTDKLKQIKYKGQETNVKIDLKSLMEAVTKSSDFYAYRGSLTTPGCHESVTWVVYKEKLTISQEQLDAFNGIYVTEEGAAEPELVSLYGNNRPIQKDNGRTLFDKTGATEGCDEFGEKKNKCKKLDICKWSKRESCTMEDAMTANCAQYDGKKNKCNKKSKKGCTYMKKKCQCLLPAYKKKRCLNTMNVGFVPIDGRK